MPVGSSVLPGPAGKTWSPRDSHRKGALVGSWGRMHGLGEGDDAATAPPWHGMLSGPGTAPSPMLKLPAGPSTARGLGTAPEEGHGPGPGGSRASRWGLSGGGGDFQWGGRGPGGLPAAGPAPEGCVRGAPASPPARRPPGRGRGEQPNAFQKISCKWPGRVIHIKLINPLLVSQGGNPDVAVYLFWISLFFLFSF